MKEHLQIWYNEWLKEHRETNLRYAKHTGDVVGLEQVHFIRDAAAQLFWADIPYQQRPTYYDEENGQQRTTTALVIGEHVSKSVRLPVYLLERDDLGLKIVLRYNFHDWNISVVSELPVKSNLDGFVTDYHDSDKRRFENGYETGHFWGYCYFQGFPEEYWFGPYRENHRRFSTYFDNDKFLFTFLWITLRDLRKQHWEKEEEKKDGEILAGILSR